ncbi:hypothetical protein [Oerskovia flava]|uniref:hypothetical protein n=1 Tax=Oerskovia flava TaxID=2986422 RepID=UPI00223EFE81|nr:hypothetical protein [Oerskovia sp. JB1-3-2]
MTVVETPAGQDEATSASRFALARSVLQRAEESAGVRRTARTREPTQAAAAAATSAPAPASSPRPAPAPRQVSAVPDERTWPVHADLAPLLPLGALQRGTTLSVQGSTGLLLSLVAQASRAGAWTAAVGFPGVGVLAAADAGADLGRFVLVPRPGPDAAVAIAALLDGMDVVVVGPQAALTDPERRRLGARARERGAVLVSSVPWVGAHVVLTARAGTWTGVDRGAGWLRRRTVLVERAGRAGAARAVRLEVEVPLDLGPAPRYLTGSRADPRTRPDATRPAEPTADLAPGPDLRLVG